MRDQRKTVKLRRLQSTLTGRKEIFKPGKKGEPVEIFTCGRSIYDWPHIGNYRTFLYAEEKNSFSERHVCRPAAGLKSKSFWPMAGISLNKITLSGRPFPRMPSP
jgi:hypothetical protein